jgi:hypothetical protein
VLVFDEGLRHFKTTVMNWHVISLECWSAGLLEC